MPQTLEAPRAEAPQPGLVFHDFEPTPDSFADAVIEGLSRRPKAIPCRFLYDQRGSQLFDAICRQPEYYPTRTELRILKDHAGEIARLIGPDAELIELGSGSSLKVRLLLDALQRPAAYVPIDISRQHLAEAARRVAAAHPDVEVHAICADYAADFDLPWLPGIGRRTAFFPGSTIGNFEPAQAEAFLSAWARRLGSGAGMLIGVDLRKDAAILDAAYDDAAGVTAAFSLNLLARANRELGADFDIDGFRHEARYLADEGRVAIHLRATGAHTVTIEGRSFEFAAGEGLHIEDSWKYTIEGFQALAVRSGYAPVECWTDADALFSVHLLRVV